MSQIQQADLSDCQILVIDDDKVNTRILSTILATDSFKILSATDGLAGLKMAKFNKPDLILLDVHMPGMNGLDVCQEIKASPETYDIPVIFLTALTGLEDIKAGFRAGGSDYICKPIRSAEVLARIRVHLEKSQLIQAQTFMIQNLGYALEEHSESIARTSHELRTPLNSIMGFSQVIRRWALSNSEPEICEQSNIILKAGDHLLTLINNMLDLAKSDAGQMVLDPHYFEVDPLLQLVQSLITPLAEKNNNSLQFTQDKTSKIYADETRLRQILLNVTANACKFTKDGEIHVHTICHQGACEFTIKDNGPGIEKNKQESIFHPYTQASKSTYSKHGGTGLGLAISHRLAKLMHGSLSVESTLGMGSEFTLSIPIEPQDVEQVNQAAG
ncbi:MAG: hybrid sensor histidine kinase/response regulator [Pseudomonadales bacterium]|nr:hybrid sensor histidine kinase/response regulator [Pseudomonadales bacterium]